MKMPLEAQIQTIIQGIQGPNKRQHPFDIDIADLPQEPIKWQTRDVRDYKTQRKMLWDIINKYTGNPILVDFAAKIIRELNIPERDNLALARGFQQYVQHNIKFFREYPERFASPLRTIQWGIGDCDDKTILLASLLRSFRLPVRLKFIRFIHPNTKKKVSHVYPQVGINGKWLTLETVQQWEIGKDGERLLHERKIPVKVEFHGDKL